jgi:hypothetical protein
MSSDAARAALLEAATKVHSEAAGAASGAEWSRVSVAPCGEHLRVAYAGDPWAEAIDTLFETIARPAVSRWIASIELAADDVGAEGKSDWELDALTPRGASYPALTTFRVVRGAPFRRNHVVVVTHGVDRGDGGAIARVCDLAPKLVHLETASAPDDTFLARKRDALKTLEVDAGEDHAGFVLDLAARGGSSLPALERLAWGEPVDRAGDRPGVTPREDYVALFRSPFFTRLRTFVWRNPPFGDTDVDALLRPARGPRVHVQRWNQKDRRL